MSQLEPFLPTDEGDAPHILVLGTAEWDSPIATNQHYVVRELARLGRVTYVESLGLRRPRLNRTDLRRMAGRLRRSTGRASPSVRPRPARATVISPVVIPWHRRPVRTVNRALLRRSTSSWTKGGNNRLLWSFTPVTYGLEDQADAAIYHCVDLLAQFPGVDGVAVRRGETTLAGKGVSAIGTSGPVSDHLNKIGFSGVHELTNVADTTIFTARSAPAAQRSSSVIFAGNLTPFKLDTALLTTLADRLRGRGELLLAGPVAAGGGSYEEQLDRLTSMGVRYLGLLSLPDLAEAAGSCAAGVIPYSINDYTAGVSPLKCFEYLSSGLAVIGTPIPEIEKIAAVNEHVWCAEGEEFVSRVLSCLHIDDQRIAERIQSAEHHGWDSRGTVLRNLARDLLEAGKSH